MSSSRNVHASSSPEVAHVYERVERREQVDTTMDSALPASGLIRRQQRLEELERMHPKNAPEEERARQFNLALIHAGTHPLLIRVHRTFSRWDGINKLRIVWLDGDSCVVNELAAVAKAAGWFVDVSPFANRWRVTVSTSEIAEQ